MAVLLIKNPGTEDIFITDVGVLIPALSVEKFVFPKEIRALTMSEICRSCVEKGTLVVCDGRDLSPSEGILFLENLFVRAGFDTWPEIPGTRTTVKAAKDVSNDSMNLMDIEGLSFSVEAHRDYGFEFVVIWSSSGVTAGIRIDLDGPPSPTALTWGREVMLTGGASRDAYESRVLTSYRGDSSTGGVDTANERRVARVAGVLRNGPNAGVLKVQFASGVEGITTTVYQGSWGIVF